MAASALNHPAIVTIYDVGEHEGVSWIAMEWVDGRTLRSVLADGQLAINTLVSLARQIADGLAAAHAKGVVHRDLKPENVMIASDGRIRILDFGLARQRDPAVFESAAASDATVEFGATIEGVILGTVGYMSPEQASGAAADFRSDQFSFGTLLYRCSPAVALSRAQLRWRHCQRQSGKSRHPSRAVGQAFRRGSTAWSHAASRRGLKTVSIPQPTS